MRIVEDYQEAYNHRITEISEANYIGDFAIRIAFSCGNEKLVDFKPFLSASQHPSIKKYLNEDLFKQFKIIDGNLNWNDYDLIFPIHDLYLGRI